MARVTLFIAGTNEPSNAETLADAFTKGLGAIPGMETETLRLRELAISHFTLDHYFPDCSLEDDFCKVQEAILGSDGVVIASPIWNFSVPAHLKNLIDRMGGFALDSKTHAEGQLKGKPFYLIFTGGAPMIAWKALMHITTIHIPEAIRYYGGAVVGGYYEPRCMPGKGVFGLVVDKRPHTLLTMEKKGEIFGKLVKRYAETGMLPLRYRIALQIRFIGQSFVNRITYHVSPYQGISG